MTVLVVVLICNILCIWLYIALTTKHYSFCTYWPLLYLVVFAAHDGSDGSIVFGIVSLSQFFLFPVNMITHESLHLA